MLFGGLQKTTLSDFPGHIAALVFTRGCNLRCPYCHNPQLLTREETAYSQDEILQFMKSRQGRLTGLVVSGGEPTLHCELPNFLTAVKELGFAIKLDTNGSNPQMVEQLLQQKIVDYVAMDVKAPLAKYPQLAGTAINTSAIAKTISLLVNSEIAHEFRTTVVSPHLTEDDLIEFGNLVEGADRYVLQPFRDKVTLDGQWSASGRKMEPAVLARVSARLQETGLLCQLRQ